MTTPWIGIGPNAFAGVAFAQGLPPEVAGNQVWTSPHNLVLHLLAETELIGAGLICLGVLAWIRKSAGLFWLEYSLLYAHFLAITALVMGVGASAD